MSATACRSVIVAGVLCFAASGAGAETPMHQKKPVKLLSTVQAKYRKVQQDQEIGSETFERRTYDDNTVVYEVSGTALMGGVLLSTRSTLVVEEESYFPRSLRSEQTVAQQTDTLRIAFSVDMYSNVAVVGSDVRGRKDSRRLVVPVGLPFVEVGAAYSWEQILFWTDPDTRDRQRIQWLDPQMGSVESGEIFLSGEETIVVLGKKTPVSVFKAERERLGPAVLYVDADRRLVRCEQNVTLFELVEWTEK